LRSEDRVELEQGNAAMMQRGLPSTPADWLEEIQLAYADALGAESIGHVFSTPVTHSNLFHLAPLVCLKFRGRKLKGKEARRVTEVALANYVANSDPDENNHGLEQRPMLAFAPC